MLDLESWTIEEYLQTSSEVRPHVDKSLWQGVVSRVQVVLSDGERGAGVGEEEEQLVRVTSSWTKSFISTIQILQYIFILKQSSWVSYTLKYSSIPNRNNSIFGLYKVELSTESIGKSVVDLLFYNRTIQQVSILIIQVQARVLWVDK